jgi:membrane dipeptidase
MLRKPRVLFLLIVTILASGGLNSMLFGQGSQTTPVDYMAIHRRAIVVDMHSDTVLRIMREQFDFGQRSSRGHMDLPRLKEGGVDVQVFACYVAPRFLPDQATSQALEMMRAFKREIAKYPKDIELAQNADDVDRIVASGRIAAILAVEGGHAIQDNIETLRTFYQLGVRYMTLTWMNTNNWADAAGGERRWAGLNDLGVRIVSEMNRLGMMVDLSHVSDETFWDVLSITTDPVILSHSCCRALCNHYRNVSDDMLRALARNGGVIGINFFPGYLSQDFSRTTEAVKAQLHEKEQELEEKYKSQPQKLEAEREKLWQERNRLFQAVPLDVLIDHIDHAVNIAGINHVGLGSDFDGFRISLVGLEDCSKLPNITKALLARGYSESDVRKILGENVLRVFRQVTKPKE